MKRTTTIKNLIGFSQEEMAMLLGVNRSQWAMYETGKRNLPLSATKQLSAILSHLQKAKETSKGILNHTLLEQQKTKEWLQQEHDSLQYKKQLLDRKILALKNKRTECFAALEVVRFLESQPEKDTALLKSIALRVSNTLNKYALHQWYDLQIKKEQLEMLKNSLEIKMKEHSNEL